MITEGKRTVADPTAPERVARYTNKMIDQGMVRVHVWVPTEANADEIKRIAAEMRSRGTQ
jgi:hypothetical protein